VSFGTPRLGFGVWGTTREGESESESASENESASE
jgi:hypothetical protein